jgi:hypothetical protein
MMTPGIAALGLLALAPAGTTSEAEIALTRAVAVIQAADFRGDRDTLARAAAALEKGSEPSLAAFRHYWRGFAYWRRAMNGFNETPTPDDLRQDLDRAVESFEAALNERPAWVEARVGLAGALGNALFLAGNDPESRERIRARYVPVARELGQWASANPRALWLQGGSQLAAPPPYGGDASKAAATYAKALAIAREEASGSSVAPWEPRWGRAELLMSLAYLYSHSALEDRRIAEAYAAGALAVAPEWHYVKDVLMPQIERLPPRREEATVPGPCAGQAR